MFPEIISGFSLCVCVCVWGWVGGGAFREDGCTTRYDNDMKEYVATSFIVVLYLLDFVGFAIFLGSTL